jgi:hypothetical protein
MTDVKRAGARDAGPLLNDQSAGSNALNSESAPSTQAQAPGVAVADLVTVDGKIELGSKKSWRDWFKVHPAATFPPTSKEDLLTLGEDIKRRGRKVPPVVWIPNPNSNERFVLDGCRRLDAEELVGIKTVIIDSNGKPQLIGTVPRTSSAIAYAWLVWNRGYRGPIEVRRISWQRRQ